MPAILFSVLTFLARVCVTGAVIFFATSMFNWNRGFWRESRKHELISSALFLLNPVLFLLVGREWYAQVFSALMGIMLLVGRKRTSDFFYLLRKGRLFRKKRFYRE